MTVITVASVIENDRIFGLDLLSETYIYQTDVDADLAKLYAEDDATQKFRERYGTDPEFYSQIVVKGTVEVV
jgi:hypothetical protein